MKFLSGDLVIISQDYNFAYVYSRPAGDGYVKYNSYRMYPKDLACVLSVADEGEIKILTSFGVIGYIDQLRLTHLL